MSNFVEDLLNQERLKELDSLKQVEVIKEIDIEFDLGNMMMSDPNELDVKSLKENCSEYVLNLTRDDVQEFVNQVYKLDVEKIDGSQVVTLPEPKMRIPRSKRIPKAKPLTKWEQFAKAKGIQKKKKEKKVYDEVTKTWKPTYGYKRINSETDDWVHEFKPHEDPFSDPFTKKTDEKNERVAKNEFKRLKNIARSSKSTSKLAVGALPSQNPLSNFEDISKAVKRAKDSTASLGKFENTFRNEKKPKNSGKKRKFEPMISDSTVEKEKNLSIMNQILNKNPKLDVEQAARKVIARDQRRGDDGEQKGKKRSTKSASKKGYSGNRYKNSNNRSKSGKK